MKKVLDWVKHHWAIVALSAVALLALPAMYFFSWSMTQGHIKAMEQKLAAPVTQFGQAKVQYHVVNATGDKIHDISVEANSQHTEWYKELSQRLREQLNAVGTRALEFNKAQHGLLIDGIFPAPGGILEQQTKPREFVQALLADQTQLLVKAGAGMPPKGEDVAAYLSQAAADESERIRRDTAVTELTAEQKDSLLNHLRELRRQRYGQASLRAAFYADTTSFVGMPVEVPTDAPPLATLWEWQERSWLHADIVRAITLANTGTGGGGVGRGVPGAVVKRVIRLDVRSAGYDSQPTGGGEGDVGDLAAGDAPDKAPQSYAASITGRVSGPTAGNKWYDVRYIGLEIVVSSRRLPEFFDALTATNFISVLDCDLQAFEPMDDLREGFYYGDEPVVRAKLELEFLLLREWRVPWMPREVKQAMRIPIPPPAEGGEAPEGGLPPDAGASGPGGRGGGPGGRGG